MSNVVTFLVEVHPEIMRLFDLGCTHFTNALGGSRTGNGEYKNRTQKKGSTADAECPLCRNEPSKQGKGPGQAF